MIFTSYINPLPGLPPEGKEPACFMNPFPPGGNKKGGKIIEKLFGLLCYLLLLCLQSEVVAQKTNVIFTDITKKAGIDFKYTIGDYSYKNIIESSGSGITVFDYNNDNLMDLFLMNGTYLEGISDPDGKVFKNSHNSLYRNNGNGTFTEVTEIAGLGGAWLPAQSIMTMTVTWIFTS
jgi:hypothetical protein